MRCTPSSVFMPNAGHQEAAGRTCATRSSVRKARAEPAAEQRRQPLGGRVVVDRRPLLAHRVDLDHEHRERMLVATWRCCTIRSSMRHHGVQTREAGGRIDVDGEPLRAAAIEPAAGDGAEQAHRRCASGTQSSTPCSAARRQRPRAPPSPASEHDGAVGHLDLAAHRPHDVEAAPPAQRSSSTQSPPAASASRRSRAPRRSGARRGACRGRRARGAPALAAAGSLTPDDDGRRAPHVLPAQQVGGLVDQRRRRDAACRACGAPARRAPSTARESTAPETTVATAAEGYAFSSRARATWSMSPSVSGPEDDYVRLVVDRRA